jgi:hypothetical protein
MGSHPDCLAEGDRVGYNQAGCRETSRAMFKSEHVTFDELSERLSSYEQKYGYSTIEFYRRYREGELGDDDELMMWAGLYHARLPSVSQLRSHPSAGGLASLSL